MKKKTGKKHYLTEMDELQRAVSKINVFENVLPVVHGKIVEDTDTYNKIQELLDVPELEEAHQFLYDIDFDELNPETVKKVNGLYDLAVSKGLIEKPASVDEPEDGQPLTEDDEDPVEGEDEEDKNKGEDGEEEEEEEGAIEDEVPKTWSDIDYPAELPNQITSPRRCFTCFYSATKDGAVKTGEAYAMAEDAAGAKAEVIGNLSKLGMNEVNIIAVETGEETADAAVGEAEETPPEGQEDAKKEADNAENTASDGGDDAAPANEETPTDGEGGENAEGEGKEGEEEGKEGEETSDEEEGEELSDEKKAELVQKYVSVWKSVLKEMKYKSYASIEVDKLGEFWNKIKKNWPEGKPDPREFMTAKNIAELELKEVKLDNPEEK